MVNAINIFMVVFLQKRIKNAINVNGPKCFWQTIKGEARNQENIIITSRVDKEKKSWWVVAPHFFFDHGVQLKILLDLKIQISAFSQKLLFIADISQYFFNCYFIFFHSLLLMFLKNNSLFSNCFFSLNCLALVEFSMSYF